MAAIATLKAVLGIDNKQYKAGLRDTKSSTQRFQRQLASVGRAMAAAFSVGAIVAASKSLINFASEIRHTSDNLEINSETLQALNAESLKYGMTVETLQKGLARLRQSQGKVIDGERMYEDAVEALNIDLDQFQKANPAEALELVAKGYARTKDRALAFSAVTDLMGRSSKEATAFLLTLAHDGLGAIEKRGRDAGHVISDEIITKLELTGTRMDQLKLRSKVFGADIVSVLATAGEAWNGYYRAQKKGNLNVVGLNPAVEKRAQKAGLLLGDNSNHNDPEDRKTIAAAKEQLSSLRNKLLYNRLSKTEKLATLQDKLAENLRSQGSSELKQLKILKERFILFEKIEALQKNIKQDADKEAQSRESIAAKYHDQIDRLQKRGIIATGRGVNTDAMASIGGMIGPGRSGLAGSDRQLQLAIAAANVRKEIERLTREMNRSIEQIRENTQPSGQP